MSEMVQRVADAMKKRSGNMLIAESFWTEMAMAAIGEMREPTKEMIAEGHRHDPLACDVGEDQIEYCYGTMWRAMIDAALKAT